MNGCWMDGEINGRLTNELWIFQAATGHESTNGDAIAQRFFPRKMRCSCKATILMQLFAAYRPVISRMTMQGSIDGCVATN